MDMNTTAEGSKMNGSRTHRSPDGAWAGGGAVQQHDGKLPIYVCNDCGREVVWATSNRTGRKYLANIAHGQSGFRFYIGASIHQCDRSLTPEVRLDKEIEEEIVHAALYELHQLWDKRDAAWDAGDKEAAKAIGEEIRQVATAELDRQSRR